MSGQFALARYKTNGELDDTFSSDGKVTTNFTSSSDEGASAIAIDSKGRIVVAGYATVDGKKAFALARYRSDGQLDTTFSGDGKLTTNFTKNRDEEAAALAIDSQDQVVVGGYVLGDGATGRFALARYREDGALDSSFGGDGKVITDFSTTSEYVTGIVIDAQGRLVVAGYAAQVGASLTSIMFALARYKACGELDTTFAGNGKLTTSFPMINITIAKAAAVALDSKGRIVMAGQAYIPGQSKFALARYTDCGELDTTFSGNGKLVTDFGRGGAGANAIVVDHKDRIVAAGYYTPDGPGDFDYETRLALARYRDNGDLDTSFSTNGKLTTDFTSSSTEAAYGVAIDSKGRIIVAGSAYNSGSRMALARYKENGDLDTTFSSDGKVATKFTSDVSARAIALDSDDRIVVAGLAYV